LGQSEVLGVQGPPSDCTRGSIHSTSVRPFSPWRSKRLIFSGKASQKAPESIVLGREDAGDVFPEDDCGGASVSNANKVDCIGKLHEFQGQVSALVGERFAQAGDGERLARGAAREHVRGIDFAGHHALGDGRHVAEVRHGRVVVREDGARERLDLGKPCGLPAERMPSDGCGLDAAANRSEFHAASFRFDAPVFGGGGKFDTGRDSAHSCTSRSRRSMVAVDRATAWATVGRSRKTGVMGIFFALMLHSP